VSAMRLSGKTAPITCAAGGIGAEVARRFRKKGASVFACDTNREQGEKTAASIGAVFILDFAQLVKVYASSREGEQRYSPAEVVDAVPEKVMGNPDSDRICTSYIERQNLSIRMGMRRMTRLTNAFSKKWENLQAAYSLWFAYYNFRRRHQTLRVTPAMESNLTDHIWSIRELLQ
jgi:hypothetical protein